LEGIKSLNPITEEEKNRVKPLWAMSEWKLRKEN
jgi:hypothetical protein